MTRILSECLLSANSLVLASTINSRCVVNDTGSSSNDSDRDALTSLTKLVGWQPRLRADQILLGRVLARPDNN